MSRKHYIATAQIIQELVEIAPGTGSAYDHGFKDATGFAAQRLAIMFATDNPRFDHDRFYRACGLPELADN